MKLENKVAIVTGGGKGIGAEICLRLAKEGAKIVIAEMDIESGNNIQKKIMENVGDAIVVNTNVADEISVNNMVEEVVKTFNKIDILINNAGITGPTKSLWEYDVEMWNKIVQVNLMGTFNCCRAIVPNMIKNNYGRIVNVASVAGKDGNANASAYSSGKAGAIGLTKALGKELADKNIAVNAVTPAGAKTRILDQMSKEHVQRMLSKVPRGRFLEIHEFTSLVCWLSSQENTFSTAAVFDISGGRSTY